MAIGSGGYCFLLVLCKNVLIQAIFASDAFLVLQDQVFLVQTIIQYPALIIGGLRDITLFIAFLP